MPDVIAIGLLVFQEWNRRHGTAWLGTLYTTSGRISNHIVAPSEH